MSAGSPDSASPAGVIGPCSAFLARVSVDARDDANEPPASPHARPYRSAILQSEVKFLTSARDRLHPSACARFALGARFTMSFSSQGPEVISAASSFNRPTSTGRDSTREETTAYNCHPRARGTKRNAAPAGRLIFGPEILAPSPIKVDSQVPVGSQFFKYALERSIDDLHSLLLDAERADLGEAGRTRSTTPARPWPTFWPVAGRHLSTHLSGPMQHTSSLSTWFSSISSSSKRPFPGGLCRPRETARR